MTRAAKVGLGSSIPTQLAALDQVIADLYALTPGEITEIAAWHRRHYPKLTGQGAEES